MLFRSNGGQADHRDLHSFPTRRSSNLSAVYFHRGDLDGAEATATRSLELRAAVLGSDHPELASTLHNLAAIRRLLSVGTDHCEAIPTDRTG